MVSKAQASAASSGRSAPHRHAWEAKTAMQICEITLVRAALEKYTQLYTTQPPPSSTSSSAQQHLLLRPAATPKRPKYVRFPLSEASNTVLRSLLGQKSLCFGADGIRLSVPFAIPPRGRRQLFPPRAVRRAPRAARSPGSGRLTGRAEPAGRSSTFAFLITSA